MKNGDKVRVISSTCKLQKGKIGQIGTLSQDEDDYPRVTFDDDSTICFSKDKLELVEEIVMKNGDKVRVIKGTCKLQKGKIGQIGTLSHDKGDYLLVKFENGSIICFSKDKLELVEPLFSMHVRNQANLREVNSKPSEPLVCVHNGEEVRVLHTSKDGKKTLLFVDKDVVRSGFQDTDVVTALKYSELIKQKDWLMLELAKINKQLGGLK